MFSPDKSTRESSTERLKYISAAQLLLGLGLLALGIVAVVKQGDYVGTYYIGGFSCGIIGSIAGAAGIYTTFKASSYQGDDVTKLQKDLQCTACIQMILGYVVFLVSISGIMMAIMFLAINSYDEEDADIGIHKTLAGCILGGIAMLLLATVLSFQTMGTCCRHQGYNQRMAQTYPSTVGTTQYSQYGQPVQPPVYSTGGYNTGPNPPSYPVSQSFGMGQQPPPYGFQQPSAPTAPPPAYPY